MILERMECRVISTTNHSLRSNHQARFPHIGDVYMMQFSGSDSEQSGWRPGIVFQNNTGNRFSPNVIAIPLTSCIKKTGQPTHVFLDADMTGLPRDSIALCENPQRMSKSNIGKFLIRLSDCDMSRIAHAFLLATAAVAYLDTHCFTDIKLRSVQLNAL